MSKIRTRYKFASIMKEVDLRCYPYRGILKEMERETGIPTYQIHKSLFKNKQPKPELAELFDKKLVERQSAVESFKKNLCKVV